MTREEFAAMLKEVEPGRRARVPYDIYEDIFPPGEPDVVARSEALKFARSLGFQIDNRPDDHAVWFYKDA